MSSFQQDKQDQPVNPDKGFDFQRAAFVVAWLVLIVLAIRSAILTPPFFPDEVDIINPGLQHITQGKFYGPSRYPGFAFIFFEVFQRLFFLVSPQDIFWAFVASRTANVAVFAINLLLCYFLTVKKLGRFWALICMVLFGLSPAVFLSGVLVKTEGLLLLFFFLTVFFCRHIAEKPGQLRWHALAGASCGLALATKILWPLILVWVVSVWLAAPGKGFSRFKSAYSGVGPLVFLLSCLAVTAAASPGLWKIADLYEYLAKDLYFDSYPSAWRAVDEPGVFPYGRFSHGLLQIIPFAIGPATYILGIVGLLARKEKDFNFQTWGAVCLAQGLFILLATMFRTPWLFTPCVPFFAYVCASFLKGSLPCKKFELWPLVRAAGLLMLLSVAVYQHGALKNMLAHNSMVHLRFVNSVGMDAVLDRQKTAFFVTSVATIKQGIDPARPSAAIKEKQFEFIFLMDDYFQNFCKYENPDFQRECEFFKSLLRGEEGYEIVWKDSARFAFQRFDFDKEASQSYYLLKRADKGKTDL